MKKFLVSLARIGNRIYQIEVEAADAIEARELADEMWTVAESMGLSLLTVHEVLAVLEEMVQDKGDEV